jgi:bacteriorhodopsin
LLNDWTCAVPIGKSTSFEGAFTHAPNEVLKLLAQNNAATHIAKAEHDLEMVVKCLFQRLCTAAFSRVRQAGAAKTLAFWECHLSPPFWQSLLAQAQSKNYKGMDSFIAMVLPPDQQK